MKLTILFVILVMVQVHTEKCFTPNQEEAQCMSLYSCPVLLQALVTQEKIAVDFVRQSHCGNWSSELHPLVCCGTQSSFIKKEIITTPPPMNIVATKPVSDFRYCGYQHADDYFGTKNVTSLDEFPWVATFKYQRDSDLDDDLGDEWVEFGCAGSLITNRFVLTAAQCLRLRTSKVVAVRLGEYNTRLEEDCMSFLGIEDCTTAQDIGIEKRIKHPKYNRRHGFNDIALLKLNQTVAFSEYIRPICLPTPKVKFAEIGDAMTMTGFGRVGTYRHYAVIKKKIVTTLISNLQCAKEFSHIKDKPRQVTDNIICSKNVEGTERSCEGDSGAPLMFSHRTQWHIEGVAVWSVETCELNYPFAYTRVVNYIDWIERTVNSN